MNNKTRPSAVFPDQSLGNDSLPRTPKNAPELECFRIRLNSADRLIGTTRDATFLFDFPVEIGDGFHLAVESAWVSATAIPAAGADRVINFRVQGLPIRNSYVAKAYPESDVIFSIVRHTDTVYATRSVTHDTIGYTLSDLGQIRNRRVGVQLTNATGDLNGDATLQQWMLDLVIYKKMD